MNIIFKLFNGKENHPHLITELPEEPNEKDYSGDDWKYTNALGFYESKLKLAKANAVPFREEDIEVVRMKCYADKDELKLVYHGWFPKPDKIYSVEGKYEIYEYPLMKVSWETEEMFQDRLKNGKRIKFAVLLKEETVNKPEKVESQYELWNEVLEMIMTATSKQVFRSKFHISRIKPK